MDQTPIVSLAGGHPLIDIDLTVVVQFALFLVLFFVANRLLFQPYLQLRERRKAGIEGARAEADRMTAEADAKLAAGPARAQPAENPGGSEAERAAAGAAGDSAKASGPGSEHHAGGPAEPNGEDADPSQHFNFFGLQPGHLFDYGGKDEYGGPFG